VERYLAQCWESGEARHRFEQSRRLLGARGEGRRDGARHDRHTCVLVSARNGTGFGELEEFLSRGKRGAARFSEWAIDDREPASGANVQELQPFARVMSRGRHTHTTREKNVRLAGRSGCHGHAGLARDAIVGRRKTVLRKFCGH